MQENGHLRKTIHEELYEIVIAFASIVQAQEAKEGAHQIRAQSVLVSKSIESGGVLSENENKRSAEAQTFFKHG